MISVKRMMGRFVRLLAVILLLLAASCSFKHIRTGDDNLWRGQLPFEEGVTTVEDVLRELGPPTQLYDFGPRIAFLYLLMEERAEGFNALVYKDTERRFLSDRAVYFFDQGGVLEKMATSRVSLPREEAYGDDTWAALPPQATVESP